MLRNLCVLVVCSCAASAACREAPTDPMLRERRGPLVTAEQPPLREDPVAGERSGQQWKRHLQAEEIERRMIFDRSRMSEHRELIKRIKLARERLDRAKTPSDLQHTRAALQAPLHALQAGIAALDRWQNSSQLLPDYDALMTALSDSYPAARLAAMSGNTEAFGQARSSFDTHLRNMHVWLERLDQDQDQDVEEGAL